MAQYLDSLLPDDDSLAVVISKAKTRLLRGSLFSKLGLYDYSVVEYYEAFLQYQFGLKLRSNRLMYPDIDLEKDPKLKKLTSMMLISLTSLCQLFYQLEDLRTGQELLNLLLSLCQIYFDSENELSTYIMNMIIFYDSKVPSSLRKHNKLVSQSTEFERVLFGVFRPLATGVNLEQHEEELFGAGEEEVPDSFHQLIDAYRVDKQEHKMTIHDKFGELIRVQAERRKKGKSMRAGSFTDEKGRTIDDSTYESRGEMSSIDQRLAMEEEMMSVDRDGRGPERKGTSVSSQLEHLMIQVNTDEQTGKGTGLRHQSPHRRKQSKNLSSPIPFQEFQIKQNHFRFETRYLQASSEKQKSNNVESFFRSMVTRKLDSRLEKNRSMDE